MKRICLLGILAVFGSSVVSVKAIQKGTQEKPQKTDLKPGEYIWEPETEAQGSIDIVIDLATQMLAVYRDGVAIGRSTISSGSKGRETPQGIYMILEKNLTHHSNKYHEASMPFMERLTWGGLAIHAGNTPGHPESHGCVHVPEDFAKKLYSLTQEGNTVLIADGANNPEPTSDPNSLFAGSSGATPESPSPSVASDRSRRLRPMLLQRLFGNPTRFQAVRYRSFSRAQTSAFTFTAKAWKLAGRILPCQPPPPRMVTRYTSRWTRLVRTGAGSGPFLERAMIPRRQTSRRWPRRCRCRPLSRKRSAG